MRNVGYPIRDFWLVYDYEKFENLRFKIESLTCLWKLNIVIFFYFYKLQIKK